MVGDYKTIVDSISFIWKCDFSEYGIYQVKTLTVEIENEFNQKFEKQMQWFLTEFQWTVFIKRDLQKQGWA